MSEANLVPCKRCGQPVSPKAETCPHCGEKLMTPLITCIASIFFALVILIMLASFLGFCS